MATKSVTITLETTIHEMAEKDSLEWMRTLGKDKPNVSGYIGYLIKKAN